MKDILDKDNPKKKINNWLIFFLINLTIILITFFITIFLEDIDNKALVAILSLFILLQTNIIIGIGFLIIYLKNE